MNTVDLLKQIKDCKTMPELNELRLPLVKAGKESPDKFPDLQAAFIKRKNQLMRIPLSQRSW